MLVVTVGRTTFLTAVTSMLWRTFLRGINCHVLEQSHCLNETCEVVEAKLLSCVCLPWVLGAFTLVNKASVCLGMGVHEAYSSAGTSVPGPDLGFRSDAVNLSSKQVGPASSEYR